MAAKADLKTTISADMTGFSATMRRAGGLAATTGAKIGKSLGGAGKALGGIAKTSAIAGAGLAAVGAAAAGVGFTLGIKNAADLGGKLADLSARTGIAAGDLAVMGRAFEDNGVSADKIGGVINKLQKTITDFGTGSKTAAKPFEKLGISFDQISKLNPSDQFQLIQSKIAAIQSPTERAAVAMQLFGKSGGELLTLFSDGKAFANAGTFLGSQAEILNRNAALFDSISDILARAGEKFQGFFVGILDHRHLAAGGHDHHVGHGRFHMQRFKRGGTAANKLGQLLGGGEGPVHHNQVARAKLVELLGDLL